eukprot:scaffold136703_cov17-Tisochrysis_lutea.AAC.1
MPNFVGAVGKSSAGYTLEGLCKLCPRSEMSTSWDEGPPRHPWAPPLLQLLSHRSGAMQGLLRCASWLWFAWDSGVQPWKQPHAGILGQYVGATVLADAAQRMCMLIQTKAKRYSQRPSSGIISILVVLGHCLRMFPGGKAMRLGQRMSL